MNRGFTFALGPELIWALYFGAAFLFAARNSPPTQEGNVRLEAVLWILPAAGVLSSFAPLFWAPASPWWLLLRIAISGLIGLYLVVVHLCGAIDYEDSRNSGVGSGFVLFLSLGLVLLTSGLVVSAIFVFMKARFPNS
jgi:hypothetical protein